MIFMRDCHRKIIPLIPRSKPLIHTASSFMLLLICLSLMSWCCVDTSKPVKLSIGHDNLTIKEEIVKRQAKHLAEETARINAAMEARTK
jgi:hypothetical protein